MEMKSILTAFIVTFGFASVRLDNQIENEVYTSKVDDEGRTQENFQNLFDSIARKDHRKTQLYRETLIGEITKERQAFDAMKEEIRIAHNKRNSGSKRNFYKKDYVSGNVKAIKRQAYERGPGYEDYDEEMGPSPTTESTIISCKMEHDSLTAGKYSLSQCTVFYCHHENDATGPVLYEIPCLDYLNKVFPDKLPPQGRELFGSLCRMCVQKPAHNETDVH